MANYKVVDTDKLDADLHTIANAIRTKSGTSEELAFPDGFATAVENIQDGGSYDKGYSDGKQAEHDRFWDAFQHNGNLTDYNSAFIGTWWDFENFYPKYNIAPINGTKMLYAWSGRASHVASLTQRLDECGIVIDVSKTTNLNQAFAYSHFTEIPSLDISKCPANVLQQTFYAASKLVTLGKLTVTEEHTYTNVFGYCSLLQNVEFEGTIGQSIDFLWCPLSTESVQNIIDHLKDLTGATAQTLTLKADIGAGLTEAQKAAITAKNWTLVY